ncbi:MAG: hypothetical protein SGCHY_000166 [Lobulomycetales sp.]
MVSQTAEVLVPSYSAWFKMEEVSDIEKAALPEFFNGRNKSKTPQIYKDYRDFMVNTYRLTADTPKGLTPFEPSIPLPPAPSKSLPADFASNGTSVSAPMSLSKPLVDDSDAPTRQKRSADDMDMYESKGSSSKAKASYSCASCQVDCTNLRYRSTKNSSLSICPVCFKDGRFPSSSTSGEFIKTADTASGSYEWSDQDVLLLLEGIELYPDNWVKVSEHVKSHSREECILKFLKLPIEDTYLESKESLGPLQYHRQLFSSAENPALSLAAFLGSSVDPKVAAASAKAAIAQLETEKNTDGTFPSGSSMEKAAASALGASAAKAHVLSMNQEKECSRLVNALVQAQIEQMDLKLKHFETLEAMLDQEKRDLQRERAKLYSERLAFRKIASDQAVRNGSSFTTVHGVSAPVESGKMVEYTETTGKSEIMQID